MPQPEPFADIKDQATRICDASSFELLSYPITGIGLPLLKMRLPALDAAARPVLLGAGIHGDEPGGVETIVKFLQETRYLVYLDEWEITLLPCINPFGYEFGIRENHQGKDLNRLFKEDLPPLEVIFAQSIINKGFCFVITYSNVLTMSFTLLIFLSVINTYASLNCVCI